MLNKIGVYMNVNFNPAVQSNTNFKAVSQKHLKAAKKCYEGYGNLMSEWYYSILDDAVLWKDISIQDAVDTMLAAKKYVSKGSMDVYNHILNRIKQG